MQLLQLQGLLSKEAEILHAHRSGFAACIGAVVDINEYERK
jgi:hypothetical protein